MNISAAAPLPLRLWQYQKERFPLLAHAPLVAAFSGAACAFSRALRGESSLPPLQQWAEAWLLCLCFFFLLRVADEVKDREIDARCQPQRPVPRGLISLRELITVAAVIAVGQAIIALLSSPRLLIVLIAGWIYFTAMSLEFGIGAWLRRHPLLYLLSHMGVMPLVDWLATACDWAAQPAGMPEGLGWFLAASYCNGTVIEIGRKLRAPAAEIAGVDTYSAVWGPQRATAAWWLAILATAACALTAAHRIGIENTMAIALAAAAAVAAIPTARYLRRPERGGWFEAAAAIWTLALYGSIIFSLRG